VGHLGRLGGGRPTGPGRFTGGRQLNAGPLGGLSGKMTVENPDVIDFIAHDPRTDEVSLVLVEYRAWGDTGQLLPDLKRKLRNYLAYVRRGHLAMEYPEYSSKRLRFDLRSASPLGEREREFLDSFIAKHLSPRNIRMTWSQYELRDQA
jgi:hypothetical protein